MVKLVKLELEMGASPNSTDNLGNTPLHYAAALGNLKLMRTLIEYGGDVKVVSLSGDTALSQAVAKGNTAMVKLLLASGANPFDVSSGSHRDQIVDNTVQSSAHRLSLVVSLSNGWSACGDLQTHYVVRTHLITPTLFLKLTKVLLPRSKIFSMLLANADMVVSCLKCVEGRKMWTCGHRYT